MKFGIDKRRAHLATLVNSGEVTREDALAEMQKDPTEGTRQDKEYVAKKLGLSEAEFDELMALPLKTHHDYPNLAARLARLKRVIQSGRRMGLLPRRAWL